MHTKKQLLDLPASYFKNPHISRRDAQMQGLLALLVVGPLPEPTPLPAQSQLQPVPRPSPGSQVNYPLHISPFLANYSLGSSESPNICNLNIVIACELPVLVLEGSRIALL